MGPRSKRFSPSTVRSFPLRFAAAAVFAAVAPVLVTTGDAEIAFAQTGGHQEEYLIGAEDELLIEVWADTLSSWWRAVDPQGMLTMPLVGTFKAEGLTVDAVKDTLTARLSRYLAGPKVYVSVARYGSCKVYVLGQVTSPAVYTFKARTTLLEAITFANGFTRKAKQSDVKIIRGFPDKTEVISVDVTRILDKGDGEGNIPLKRGDFVYVPKSFISNVGEFLSNISPALLAIQQGLAVTQVGTRVQE